MCRVKLYLVSLLLLSLVVSCQKADDNGALGGFWKLLEVESVATGEKSDRRSNGCFMSIQLDLMQLRGPVSQYARFQHSGDSLFVQIIGDNADEELLKSFGFSGSEERFFVQKLTGKSLVLKSVYSILTFKKF